MEALLSGLGKTPFLQMPNPLRTTVNRSLERPLYQLLLMNYLKDPKLCELWYIPYYGQCGICIVSRIQLLGWLVRLGHQRSRGNCQQSNPKGPKDPPIRYLGFG